METESLNPNPESKGRWKEACVPPIGEAPSLRLALAPREACVPPIGEAPSLMLAVAPGGAGRAGTVPGTTP